METAAAKASNYEFLEQLIAEDRVYPTDWVAILEAITLPDRVAAFEAKIACLEAKIVELEGDPDRPVDGRLDVKIVAHRLSCSVDTIERRCKTGQIDALKVNGRWRIRLD